MTTHVGAALALALLGSDVAAGSQQAALVPEARSLVRIDPSAAGVSARDLGALDLDIVFLDRDGAVDLIAGARDRERLERLGIPYTVVHEDLSEFYASRLLPREQILGTPPLGAWLSPPFGSGSMGGYYTWSEVVSVLDQISARYPDLTTDRFSIGTSIEGRGLWALKLSDQPDLDEDEPEVRFDALHHAREPQGMQTVLWVLLGLLEAYGTDPLATYLVNERELWFLPVVNPDGYVYNQQTNPGGGGLWRWNRRNNGNGTFGVDLNRNYSFQWGFDDVGSSPTPGSQNYRGSAPASEPEVAAMQGFLSARSFQTALSVHTYSDLWLEPWGYIAAGPSNEAQYDEVSALATELNGYVAGPGGEILYVANGVTRDYDHGTHGTMSWHPEIGGPEDGFWPPTSRIIPLAQENLEAFQRTAWAAGAYVHETSRVVAEVGNGNGAYDPGERLEVVLLLRNSGRGAAPVNLTLTSASPAVTVSRGLVSLGNVMSFTSASNAATPLLLDIHADALPNTVVSFTCAVEYQGFAQATTMSFAVSESGVWVDWGYSGAESGTFAMPFNTLAEAVVAAPLHETIRFRSAGSSAESPLTIDKALTFESPAGLVTIQ